MIKSARLLAMQILVSIGTVGASPQIGEILPPCDFFLTALSCPVLSLPFFSILRPGRTALPIFTLYGPNDVFPRRMVFLGVRTIGAYLRKTCPQNSLKMGVNRQFPAKTAKYKNRNISKTINRIKTKFEDQAVRDVRVQPCHCW